MAVTAALMREIHRLRKFARDLQEQLDRIPRQLRAQQARAAAAEAAFREGQEAIKKAKVTAHEKEVAIRSAHSKIDKRTRQLQEAAAAGAPAKEIDGLRKELNQERETIQKLEEEVLAALAEGEERTAALPGLEAAMKQARDDLAAFERSVGERRDGLTAQLAQTQAQLKEAEAGVPANLRVQYNRIVTAMGVDGFALVQGRTCTACHTEITAQNYHDLQSGSFLLCKSCGRILYPPEPPPGGAEDRG